MFNSEKRANKRAAKALDEAAVLISKNGWTQGQYTSYTGAFCAIGAIDRVTRGNEIVAWNAAKALAQVVAPLVKPQVVFDARDLVFEFNDVKAKSAADVLTAMNRASRKLRSGEIRLETINA